MSFVADNDPVFENFRIEDAEQWRAHDPIVEKDLCYFEVKTGGKRMPRRADLNPVDMKPSLSEVALLELIYDDGGAFVDAKVSLVGGRLESFYGAVTGKLVSEYDAKEVCERVFQACKHCTEFKKPIMVMADALSNFKRYLTIAALYLPMSSDGITVDRIFLHAQVKSKYSDWPTSNAIL